MSLVFRKVFLHFILLTPPCKKQNREPYSGIFNNIFSVKYKLQISGLFVLRLPWHYLVPDIANKHRVAHMHKCTYVYSYTRTCTHISLWIGKNKRQIYSMHHKKNIKRSRNLLGVTLYGQRAQEPHKNLSSLVFMNVYNYNSDTDVDS